MVSSTNPQRNRRFMDFYLVRHGEAKSELEDPGRPLNDHGRGQVEKVSRALAAKGIRVSKILHSDKLRAKETAETLARYLSPAGGTSEVKGLAPEDDPSWFKTELDLAGESLMLVGHLPHLGRLAALLVAGDAERNVTDFPPATVVCLSRALEKWELRWIVTPQSA